MSDKKLTNIDTFTRLTEKAIGIYKSSVAKSKSLKKQGRTKEAVTILNKAIDEMLDIKSAISSADDKTFDVLVSQGKELATIAAADGYINTGRKEMANLQKEIGPHVDAIRAGEDKLAHAAEIADALNETLANPSHEDRILLRKNLKLILKDAGKNIDPNKYTLESLKKAFPTLYAKAEKETAKTIRKDFGKRLGSQAKSYGGKELSNSVKDYLTNADSESKFSLNLKRRLNTIKSQYTSIIDFYLILLRIRRDTMKKK